MLEGIALLLLAISAILFQRSATAPWIETVAADGTRYRVSPIGVAEFRDNAVAPTSECRWWPRLGDQQLCAISDTGGTQGMAWLRRAYPLTVVALWASVLVLFLNALRVPRQVPSLRLAAAVALPVIASVAIWSVWSGAPRALAVLEGLSPHPVWSGFGAVLIGAGLTAIAAMLLTVSRQ